MSDTMVKKMSAPTCHNVLSNYDQLENIMAAIARPEQYIYPTMEAACADLETELQHGWNVTDTHTLLVWHSDRQEVYVDVWNDPDFRQKLKDLLDIDLNIIT